MTTAQNGLAKALARSASGDVIALAEMSAADLMAGMTDDQKADLAASLAPPTTNADDSAAGDMPSKKKEGCSDDEDDDDKGGDSDPMANAADDRVKIVAAAVAGDDACKGKADLALSMLADDDFAGLSGNALVKLIGKTPVEGASASSADLEAGARAAMKDALAQQGNSKIDAGGSASKSSETAAAASVWGTAIANEFGQKAK